MQDTVNSILFKSRGALIGHNTAIIKPFWIKLRRAPKGTPFDPTIVVNGMKLANPAAIVYECLVNGEWGMGAPDSLIDQASFSAAATTLANEGFGLAMLWHKQDTVEAFIGVVLDHIEAALALDPFTGTFRIKLIRDDYNVEDLPVFGPHNAELSNFERKAWGETINEINVSWTSPANEQTETVTVHDTANLQLQGGIVSETRDYFGIRTADMALRVATRDLLAASSALASATMRINRQAWRVLPGDVIALTWPEYGYELIPMRVGEVDYGAPGDSKITLALVEDVFGMPDQSYVTSDGTAWVNPSRPPEPLEIEHLTSAPYYAVVQEVGEASAEAIPDTSDFTVAFGTHSHGGVYHYELMAEASDANGNTAWLSYDTVNLAGYGELQSPLVAEVTSIIAGLDNVRRGENAVAGAMVWIGPIDSTGELGLLKAVDGDGYHIGRGVLDTVPKAWPAGTPVWLLLSDAIGSTGIERSLGETATVRMLPTTSQGRLDIADAADVSHVMTGRLHRPYRPGNVALDGVLFPATPPEVPVTLTWAGRNRIFETALIAAWDAGSMTPEDGVTYTLEFDALQGDGTLIQANYRTVTGLTGESYVVDTDGTEPGGTGLLDIRLYAVRDGLQSWQPATHRVRLFAAPYNLTGVFIPD